MGYLILVRHGESRWNKQDKFTGWVDVPLSEKGIKEALICAKQLEKISFDVAYTSKLQRATETLLIILSKQNHTGIFLHNEGKEKRWSFHTPELENREIPIYSNVALNERYYGALQGVNKSQARKKYGKEQVFEWRRSYDIRPPNGESLKDTIKRTLPYFKKNIMKDVKSGKNVIVSAHGNSLRGIIKHIENISNYKIASLEVPTGKPIVYKFEKGKLVKKNKI